MCDFLLLIGKISSFSYVTCSNSIVIPGTIGRLCSAPCPRARTVLPIEILSPQDASLSWTLRFYFISTRTRDEIRRLFTRKWEEESTGRSSAPVGYLPLRAWDAMPMRPRPHSSCVVILAVRTGAAVSRQASLCTCVVTWACRFFRMKERNGSGKRLATTAFSSVVSHVWTLLPPFPVSVRERRASTLHACYHQHTTTVRTVSSCDARRGLGCHGVTVFSVVFLTFHGLSGEWHCCEELLS